MFTPPEGGSGSTANIVGIDPGSETLGLSIITFDIDTFKIVSSQAKTYYGSKMFHEDNWMSNLHGARTTRIYHHKQNLINLLHQIDPLQIACESPFYNPRRPNAYGVLVEVLTMIRQSVMEYDPWKFLYLIDPPTVKKSVGAPGNADKDRMFSALCNLNDLNLINPIDTLDEHSVDALAVAYCRLKMFSNSVF